PPPPRVDNTAEIPPGSRAWRGAVPVLFSRCATMESMRMAPPGTYALWEPCCRCHQAAFGWDHIAGKPYCPGCEEAIVPGAGEPLIEHTERRPCSVCRRVGVVTVQTLPLNRSLPLEMDLCPDHLRGLLGRRLPPPVYAHLRRRLAGLGLQADDVFLLHDAFY